MGELLRGKIYEGHLAEIVNLKPVGGASKTYIVATVEWDSNKTEDFLLFTNHEVAVAKSRAERHPELHPKESSTLGIFKSGFSQVGHVVYSELVKKINWRQPAGYYFVRLADFDGQIKVYAFTPNAMTNAQRRSVRNPEDKPKKGMISDFLEDIINKIK